MIIQFTNRWIELIAGQVIVGWSTLQVMSVETVGKKQQRQLRYISSRASSIAGLSLLEVVLSLAILSMAAAYLAQSVFLATENALRSQELSQAELVAESLMNQIVAGVLPAQPVNWVSYSAPNSLGSGALSSELQNWVYSISNVGTEVQGMIGVQIAVEQVQPGETPSGQPVLTVTRWIIDPQLGLDLPATDNTAIGTTTANSMGGASGAGSATGMGNLSGAGGMR